MNSSPKQKVIFYIDGFNFYFGLKSKKWKKYYWLDMVKFCESFLKPHQELVQVNYFSAIQKNNSKADRQDKFFVANKLNPKFKLHLGKYLQKNFTCKSCKSSFPLYEEKETDVRIAVEMIKDAVKNNCDISILISADSDLIPPIEFMRELKSSHKIWTYFPPKRFSYDLKNLTDRFVLLDRHQDRFEKSILNEKIKLESGYILEKPKHWK